MSKKQAVYSSQEYVSFLNNGEEHALDYFYTCYNKTLYAKARLATGDADISLTIVQEAFFRLWLFRTRVTNLESVQNLLEDEVKRAARDFYGNPSEQFRRNFVQLEPYHTERKIDQILDTEEEHIYSQQDPEDRAYIRKINALMPNLRKDQQTLIRLCLEYSFNFDKIADRLGGISSLEVRLRAERAIAHMRSVFENTEKLQKLESERVDAKVINLNSEEALVLHLRFDKKQTFTEIASALDVDLSVANHLFVQAYRKSKLAVSSGEYVSLC